ncbi:MAG: glycoside hydrolase family 3 N-terminal domain-containing protein, partial [Acidobacteriota bacterium]
PTRAVMVAHALSPTLGEAVRPASLSETIVGRLHRAATGPIIADDLEMGALVGHGFLGERAAAALRAGCDQVLVCNALGERAAVAAHVEAWAARDPGLAAALRDGAARVAGFGGGPQRLVEWHEVVESVARARGLAGEGP